MVEKIRSSAQGLCEDINIAFSVKPETGKITLYRDVDGYLQLILVREIDSAGYPRLYDTPLGVFSLTDEDLFRQIEFARTVAQVATNSAELDCLRD